MRAFWLILNVLICLPSTLLSAEPKTSYEDQVKPIFRKHCFTCHQGDRPRGELDLTTYEATLAGGATGKSVISGKPMESPLYVLTAHLEKPTMPPNKPKIPQRDIAIIRLWIEGGLLEKEGGKAIASTQAEKGDVSTLIPLAKDKTAPPVVTVPPKSEPSETKPRLPIIPQTTKIQITPIARPAPILALAVSSQSPLFAIAGEKQVLIYHDQTHECIAALPFKEGEIHVLRFARDGKYLLAGGGIGGVSGKVVVYEVGTGKIAFTVGNESDSVIAADISPDNQMIALGGSGRVVKVYSREGKLLHTLKKHTDWVLSIAFSPEGLLLASGDRNNGILVWEAKSGKEFMNLRGPTAAITGLSWRADSDVLAASSEDGSVHLWEMHEGKETSTWIAHSGGALALDYHPNGMIATAGRDQLLKLWNADGKAKGTFGPTNDHILKVGFTAKGDQVIAGDFAGETRLWSITGKQIASITLPVQNRTVVRNTPNITPKIPPTKSGSEETKLPEIAELKAKQNQLISENENLSKRLPTLEQELQELKNLLTNAEANLRTTEQAVQQAKKSVESIQIVVQSRMNQLQEWNTQFKRNQELITQHSQEIDSWQKGISTPLTELEAQRTRIEKEWTTLSGTVQEKKKLALIAAETATQIRSLYGANEKAVLQSQELENTLNEEVHQLEGKIQKLGDEMAKTQKIIELARRVKQLQSEKPLQ